MEKKKMNANRTLDFDIKRIDLNVSIIILILLILLRKIYTQWNQQRGQQPEKMIKW